MWGEGWESGGEGGNTACPNYSDLMWIRGGYLDEAAGASVARAHAFLFFSPLTPRTS